MSVHDAVTSVRLEVREVYKAPENQTCVNRHVFGVGEKIEFLSYPKSSEMGLVAESFNLREERTTFYNSFNGENHVDLRTPKIYTAPFVATHSSTVTVSFKGVDYTPQISFVEPCSVVCRGAARDLRYPCLPPGEVGGSMMLTTNYIAPMHVSFQGILVAEIPCSDVVPPTGYYATTNYTGPLSHTEGREGAGAGGARQISPGNYWTIDSAGTPIADNNWGSGRMEWKVPIGWIRMIRGIGISCEISEPEFEIYQDSNSRRLLIGQDDTYRQVFTIDENGTSKIEKHGHWLSRSRNCVIKLDGEVIQESHVEEDH